MVADIRPSSRPLSTGINNTSNIESGSSGAFSNTMFSDNSTKKKYSTPQVNVISQGSGKQAGYYGTNEEGKKTFTPVYSNTYVVNRNTLSPQQQQDQGILSSFLNKLRAPNPSLDTTIYENDPSSKPLVERTSLTDWFSYEYDNNGNFKNVTLFGKKNDKGSYVVNNKNLGNFYFDPQKAYYVGMPLFDYAINYANYDNKNKIIQGALSFANSYNAYHDGHSNFVDNYAIREWGNLVDMTVNWKDRTSMQNTVAGLNAVTGLSQRYGFNNYLGGDKLVGGVSNILSLYTFGNGVYNLIQNYNKMTSAEQFGATLHTVYAGINAYGGLQNLKNLVGLGSTKGAMSGTASGVAGATSGGASIGYQSLKHVPGVYMGTSGSPSFGYDTSTAAGKLMQQETDEALANMSSNASGWGAKEVGRALEDAAAVYNCYNAFTSKTTNTEGEILSQGAINNTAVSLNLLGRNPAAAAINTQAQIISESKRKAQRAGIHEDKTMGGAAVGGAIGGAAGFLAGGVGALAGTLIGEEVGSSIMAGLGSGHNTARDRKKGAEDGAMTGAAIGATIGSFGSPVGSAIGAIIGAASGAIIGVVNNSGKFGHGREHIHRNMMREQMSFSNVFSKQMKGEDHGHFFYNLADGRAYNVGRDGAGNHCLDINGDVRKVYDPSRITGERDFRKQKDGSYEMEPYDIDYTSNLDSSASILSLPLMLLGMGRSDTKDQQEYNQMLGYITNAVTSNTDHDMTRENWNTIVANIKAGYGRTGIQNKTDALTAMYMMFMEGKVTNDDYINAKYAIDLVFDSDGFNRIQSTFDSMGQNQDQRNIQDLGEGQVISEDLQEQLESNVNSSAYQDERNIETLDPRILQSQQEQGPEPMTQLDLEAESPIEETPVDTVSSIESDVPNQAIPQQIENVTQQADIATREAENAKIQQVQQQQEQEAVAQQEQTGE